MKVAIVQRIFTHYRKPIFDLLSQECQLELLHASNKSGIKQSEANYSHEVPMYKLGKNETNVFINIFPYLFKKRPDVLIHEFAVGIVSLPLAFLFCKIFRIKFILWSHGYNRKKGFHPKSKLVDGYRLMFMKLADALVVYGQQDKEFLSQFITKNKIFVAQNTIDIESLTTIRDRLVLEGVGKIKEELNFAQYNLIYIGRILKSKRPEVLVEILEYLKPKLLPNDLKIHFVGENVDMLQELKQKVESKGLTDNIIFYGHVEEDELVGKMLYASDLMIMPGKLGLSINHAFCFDCPVVSFSQGENGPFHSPEVEYLIDNETGFMVKEHTADAMAQVIYNYLSDKQKKIDFKKNIRRMVEKVFTMHNMIKGFVDSAFYTLSNKKKVVK